MTSRTRQPRRFARAGVLAVLALVLGTAVAATVGGARLAARSAQSGDALPPLYLDDAAYGAARVDAGLSDPGDPGRALATPPTRSAYLAAVQANLACLVRNGNPKLANRGLDATVQTRDDGVTPDGYLARSSWTITGADALDPGAQQLMQDQEVACRAKYLDATEKAYQLGLVHDRAYVDDVTTRYKGCVAGSGVTVDASETARDVLVRTTSDPSVSDATLTCADDFPAVNTIVQSSG